MMSNFSGRASGVSATAALLRGASFAAFALASTSIAHAQDGATVEDQSAPAQSAESGYGDIIVTASRRETRLQDTAMTISAVGGEQLDNLRVTQIQDIIRFVPGLQANEIQVGQRRVTVRGVQSAGEATVGVYYGETPVTGPTSASNDPSGATPDINFYDVDRVEVLRGPQGTLFGSGSMSGTMRILFRQPELDRFAGGFDLEGSSTRGGDGSYYAKGFVNAPIIEDKLAARLVLFTEKRGGWVDNVRLNQSNINKSTVSGGRLALKFKPADNFDLLLTAIHQETDVDDTSAYNRALGPFHSDFEQKVGFWNKLDLFTLQSNWELPFATVTLAASRFEYEGQKDVESTRAGRNAVARGTYCRLYHNITTACNATQLAQYQAYGNSRLPLYATQPMELWSNVGELRMTSNGKGPFKWTAGLFYERRSDDSRSFQAKADPVTGLPEFPIVTVGDRTVSVDLTQKAVFGELSYDVTDWFGVTVGARRYDYDKTTRSQILQTSIFNGAVAGPLLTYDSSESGWVTKGTVNIKPTDDILVYATYSEGFRPGGANNVPGLPDELVTYRSDSLKNYELGVKSTLFDRKLILNGAVYRIDWRNMQTQATTANNSFNYLTNIGASRIEGIELEGSLQIVQGLRLGGNLNKLFKSELTVDQINPIATAPGRKGDRIPYEPQFTAAVSLDYEVGLTDDLDGLFHIDYSYTGKSYTTLRPTDANYADQGGFSVVNARIGVESDGWGVFAFVRNIGDVVGAVRVAPGVNSYRAVIATQPRSFGVSVRKTF